MPEDENEEEGPLMYVGVDLGGTNIEMALVEPGGRIIVRPSADFRGPTDENIIVGNTVLYGAIAGEAFISGVAGERFCVRNSGIQAVVEGVGDHGCEYMTGGCVVVIGETGRNFAAGMSGGVAYVYDPHKHFKARCNLSMVVLEALEKEDEEMVKKLVSNHYGRITADNLVEPPVYRG